jgi:asparagine synthetase B (glutamine-hydrolysing)
LLRDVRKLPPGHFFKADRAGFLITRWHEQAKSRSRAGGRTRAANNRTAVE